MSKRARSGATLIEVMIAVAIGSLVIGSAMYLYWQGTMHGAKSQDHASIRQEAMLVLETLARDLDQLMVSEEPVPTQPGQFYLTRPFELSDLQPQTGFNPVTKQPITENVATSITFYRYHHTDAVPGSNPVMPRMVGQKIVYKSEPAPGGGMNLRRNGEIVNKTPLAVIMFKPAKPIVAAENVGGAPFAILEVQIVPKNGMWGKMTEDTVNNLRKEGQVLSRIFHLIGYESQYTAYLAVALAKVRGKAMDLAKDGDTRFYDPNSKKFSFIP